MPLATTTDALRTPHATDRLVFAVGSMGTKRAAMLLAFADRDVDFADLSDYGINTLRETGVAREVLGRLLRDELERCQAIGAKGDEAGLALYLRAKRAGNPVRINRAARVAIFCQLAGRRFI